MTLKRNDTISSIAFFDKNYTNLKEVDDVGAKVKVVKLACILETSKRDFFKTFSLGTQRKNFSQQPKTSGSSIDDFFLRHLNPRVFLDSFLVQTNEL